MLSEQHEKITEEQTEPQKPLDCTEKSNIRVTKSQKENRKRMRQESS